MLNAREEEGESMFGRESGKGSLAGCSTVVSKKVRTHRRGSSYQ